MKNYEYRDGYVVFKGRPRPYHPSEEVLRALRNANARIAKELREKRKSAE